MASMYRYIGWGYAGVCTALAVGAWEAKSNRVRPEPTYVHHPAPIPVRPSLAAEAAEWFRRVKPYCNSVEVATLERRDPPPHSVDGAGYHAACLALAGRIDGARRAIDALPVRGQRQAAYIVFDVGHPVADAGDDRSAGPIMELVVDYVPSHYMALYHAGMAEYMLGQRDLAQKNLTEFLKYYSPTDGWRSNAIDVLGRLNDPKADLRRPREP